MVQIIEVGIPVYNALDTLPNLLDSLVAQTEKDFNICLSIDGDNNDYSGIIRTYRARGLKIRVIDVRENGGPGMARQRILDSTQSDYIIFADADDMLMPYSIDILYRGILMDDYDIIRSSFIRENKNGMSMVLKAQDNTITWFHGKIYKVEYLKRIGLSFVSWLRIDEDAYFNIIAWSCTEKRGIIDEITYIWRDNENSLTRKKTQQEYFKDTYMSYIGGQVAAMKKIFEIKKEINSSLVTQTLINIYYYYMKARFYHLDEIIMDNCLTTLKDESWFLEWINNGENWKEILNTIKAGQIYEENHIVFFEETFNLWAARLLRKE